MKIIVISPEETDSEIGVVTELFREELSFFHLRKPGFDESQLRKYLDQIPAYYLTRIVLHSHHHLAKEYNLKGVHYSESKRRATDVFPDDLQISSSFHSLDDLEKVTVNFDYVFLSPIFDSISKSGYLSPFNLELLQKSLSSINQNVVALGGIDERNAGEIKEIGFAGVALLGAIWNDRDPVGKFKVIKSML